ncbi:MAG: tetratricopeptide repeat protein [Bacteroidales bacterium]|nr:tetratricopeptide repeat protein [Bacteroidales bacterium]
MRTFQKVIGLLIAMIMISAYFSCNPKAGNKDPKSQSPREIIIENTGNDQKASTTSIKASDTSKTILMTKDPERRKKNAIADSLMRTGSEKAKNENYAGAMADFEKVIELDPENFKAYYFRGNARNELGH